jgi:hypothetical protein
MGDDLRTVSSARPGNVPDVAATYHANGFFLFRQGLDARLVKDVAAIEEEVVRPYTGPLLRHNGKVAPHDHALGPPWDVARRQSGLLNPHRLGEGPLRAFSEATTRLLTSQSLFDCLHKLDGGDRYTLHQSIFFFVSARTDTHQDRVTLDTVPAGRSFTVWIPVDRVRPANGPLFVRAARVGGLRPGARGHWRQRQRCRPWDDERRLQRCALRQGRLVRSRGRDAVSAAGRRPCSSWSIDARIGSIRTTLDNETCGGDLSRRFIRPTALTRVGGAYPTQR